MGAQLLPTVPARGGCSPGEYWRRTTGRPFPAPGRARTRRLDVGERDGYNFPVPSDAAASEIEPSANARRVLVGYRDGVISLESLIAWADELEATAPSDPWLRRTAESLADPLLCRERAMAFVRDLLGD